MELYIRGAWRTFSSRPKRLVGSREPLLQQQSFRNLEDDLTGFSVQLLGENHDGVPIRPKIIFTRNVSELQAFYSAVLDAEAISRDEHKCVLRLSPKEHVVLVDRDHTARGRINQYAEIGMHEMDFDKANTKRRRKAVAVNVASVETLLVSYGRAKRQGIMPIHTAVHGIRLAMRFEDPDGNLVEMHSDVSERLKRLDLIGKNGNYESKGRMVEIDPEHLVERLRLREGCFEGE